jgi:hypothetical protein
VEKKIWRYLIVLSIFGGFDFMGKISIVPFGIVPKISTLIIDSDLNLGSHVLRVNNVAVNTITELTDGQGVIIPSIHSDLIDDTIIGKGTVISEIATHTTGIAFLASNNERSSDLTEETNTGGGYTLIKTLTIPDGYMDGGSVNASWQARRTGSGASQTRIYVNGVAYGSGHNTYSATYKTFYQVVTGLKSGDTVELWCDSSFKANVVYIRNYTLGADDHMFTKQLHTKW